MALTKYVRVRSLAAALTLGAGIALARACSWIVGDSAGAANETSGNGQRPTIAARTGSEAAELAAGEMGHPGRRHRRGPGIATTRAATAT